MSAKSLIPAFLAIFFSSGPAALRSEERDVKAEAANLIEQARREALKAADEVDRGIALGEVAGLQAKSGDSSAAFATMKAIEQKKKTLRQLALRNIAIGQGKSGNLKGARQTLKQTKGAF